MRLLPAQTRHSHPAAHFPDNGHSAIPMTGIMRATVTGDTGKGGSDDSYWFADRAAPFSADSP